jgi:hypothetical protein
MAFRARLKGRRSEQSPGIHFDPKSIAAPGVTMLTIRIVFIIMIMARWSGHVFDVRGAFRWGDFVSESAAGYGKLVWQQGVPTFA